MPKRASVFVAVMVLCGVVSPTAQQAPQLHVVRISSGPTGVEEKGAFRLTEERSVFSRTDDKEVIVYFQWDGAPGRHLLEAVWRSPDGSSSSKSTIDYTAKDRRFGAYWRFTMTPDIRLGTWSIEATVDGQPGGRFTFEITGAPAPAAAPLMRPLTQPELHALLSKHFVVLTRKAPGPKDLDPAAGSVVAPGQIVTAVRLLDSVDRVAAVSSVGTTHDITTIVDLNRGAGWAILESNTGDVPALPHASTPKVGDRCYSMQGAEGTRVLLEGQITGTIGSASPVEGWIVSFFNGVGAAGAPVINEYGEALGMLGGRPAADNATAYRSFTSSAPELGNIPVIPIGRLKVRSGTAPATFAALRARGLLLEPLVLEEHIVSGGFASETPRGTIPPPQIQRDQFSHADKRMVVFVTWGPRARLKGQAAFHLFDSSNARIASSKLSKVDFRNRDLTTSLWQIPVTMAPGSYRAELHFDGKPVWRSYVRIIP